MTHSAETDAVLKRQEELCKKYGSPVVASNVDAKIGIAIESLGQMPITGVRVRPENGTDGWYIYAGEYSDHPDFFKPVHVSHIAEILPLVLPYLSLSPGHKFIIDDEGYEDVWYDAELLEK
jgi:hypothetical protein